MRTIIDLQYYSFIITSNSLLVVYLLGCGPPFCEQIGIYPYLRSESCLSVTLPALYVVVTVVWYCLHSVTVTNPRGARGEGGGGGV